MMLRRASTMRRALDGPVRVMPLCAADQRAPEIGQAHAPVGIDLEPAALLAALDRAAHVHRLHLQPARQDVHEHPAVKLIGDHAVKLKHEAARDHFVLVVVARDALMPHGAISQTEPPTAVISSSVVSAPFRLN